MSSPQGRSLYDFLKEQEQSEGCDEKGLSLEKWRELGENGVTIPIEIPLHGTSMKPLISPEKDIVTILPMVREPMVGDIVLFRRPDGKSIAHRIYSISANQIQTWGDNCYRADIPIRREDIYGLIVSVVKNGKIYQLDNDKQRACGIRWIKYGRPIWMIPKMIKAIGRKFFRNAGVFMLF